MCLDNIQSVLHANFKNNLCKNNNQNKSLIFDFKVLSPNAYSLASNYHTHQKQIG